MTRLALWRPSALALSLELATVLGLYPPANDNGRAFVKNKKGGPRWSG